MNMMIARQAILTVRSSAGNACDLSSNTTHKLLFGAKLYHTQRVMLSATINQLLHRQTLGLNAVIRNSGCSGVFI